MNFWRENRDEEGNRDGEERGMNNNKEGGSVRSCFRKRAVKGATLTIPKGVGGGMGWEEGQGGQGGMQTRNASRMRSNGPGELLADRREGRVHGT